MAGNEKSKLKLLYLMDIFKKKTDDDHVLTANELCDELEACGISAERKSIYKDINILIEYGMDIVHTRSPKNGFFLGQRDFELAEVRLLVDAVQAANFISTKKTKQLLSKIEDFVSREQAAILREQVYVDNRPKCKNEEIYYIIDTLHSAITKNLQVSFIYVRRRLISGGAAKREEKAFTVNPYAMIWSDDHYYLICNNPKYDNLMHLRIDRIRSINMLNTKARHFSEVTKYKNYFDSADYATGLFNMYTGEQQSIRLKCKNEILENILDRFGENIPINDSGDGYFTVRVDAAVNEGLVGWLMQYGHQIEVIAPTSLRSALRKQARAISKLYSSDEE